MTLPKEEARKPSADFRLHPFPAEGFSADSICNVKSAEKERTALYLSVPEYSDQFYCVTAAIVTAVPYLPAFLP